MSTAGLGSARARRAPNAQPARDHFRVPRLVLPAAEGGWSRCRAGPGSQHLGTLAPIMTLLGYQQALCDMVASPALCVRVRKDPTSALSSYDISPKERGRLSAVAHQRGMSTNCTLHRLNRMTPIYSY